MGVADHLDRSGAGAVRHARLARLPLFKKFTATLGALDELGQKVAALTDNVEKLAPDPVDNAIELGYPVVARQRERYEQARDEKKQARREARLARGKLLINPETIPTLRK